MSDSGLIWFAQQCRVNDVPLQRYIARAEGAGDWDLADFLRRALHAAGEISGPPSRQPTMSQ